MRTPQVIVSFFNVRRASWIILASAIRSRKFQHLYEQCHTPPWICIERLFGEFQSTSTTSLMKSDFFILTSKNYAWKFLSVSHTFFRKKSGVFFAHKSQNEFKLINWYLVTPLLPLNGLCYFNIVGIEVAEVEKRLRWFKTTES